MRRKEVLLCAWPFEGISQGVPFMDASHKHPESDAQVEAPQKATTAPEFFDTDDSLDPSATK